LNIRLARGQATISSDLASQEGEITKGKALGAAQ